MTDYPAALDTDANLYVAANLRSTTLTAPALIAAATLTVGDTTGYPDSGILMLEVDASPLVDFRSYTGKTATSFTGVTPDADPLYPSQDHDSGVVVVLAVVAQHHNALKDAIKAEQAALGVNPQGGSATVAARFTAGESATAAVASDLATETTNRGADVDAEESARIAADAAHVAAADPHPQYATTAEAAAAAPVQSFNARTGAVLPLQADYDPFFTTPSEATTIADAQVAAHVALADPHTQYQKESEKGAAGGYASLDGSSLIPDAQIPAAIARDTEVAQAVADHVALADPHTQYQRESEKGVAGGYASLDGGGKVPVAQLPNSIMEYQGTWNAATNTPPLADGVGSIGDVYRATVAGTQDLGSGAIAFGVGDYAILNASLVWEKADTTDAVSSVDGLTGAVSLPSDAAAGTGSKRTLGTGALQAAAGNDARFTDARAPTAHASTHNSGGGDALAADSAAATPSLRSLGSGAAQAAAGNDSRLSDSRAPTAHKTTHEPGGSDAMAVDAAAATGSLRTLGTGAAQAAVGSHTHAHSSLTGLTSGDDHTQYQLESEKNAASGYAGLTASSKIAASQIQEVIALEDLSNVTAKTGTGATVVMDTSPTIATPTVNIGSDATGDLLYRASGGGLARLGLGAQASLLLGQSAGLPAWSDLHLSAYRRIKTLGGAGLFNEGYVIWETGTTVLQARGEYVKLTDGTAVAYAQGYIHPIAANATQTPTSAAAAFDTSVPTRIRFITTVYEAAVPTGSTLNGAGLSVIGVTAANLTSASATDRRAFVGIDSAGAVKLYVANGATLSTSASILTGQTGIGPFLIEIVYSAGASVVATVTNLSTLATGSVTVSTNIPGYLDIFTIAKGTSAASNSPFWGPSAFEFVNGGALA